MTEDQQQPRTTNDPFLEEIHRLKREAVADMNMAELVKHLREIEKQYKDRLILPPDESGTSAA
jgi:predicted N-acetyltransferase YhbS